jgi:hypothetical protein
MDVDVQLSVLFNVQLGGWHRRVFSVHFIIILYFLPSLILFFCPLHFTLYYEFCVKYLCVYNFVFIFCISSLFHTLGTCCSLLSSWQILMLFQERCQRDEVWIGWCIAFIVNQMSIILVQIESTFFELG